MPEPSLALGGVGTRFQSLAGEVSSCRNWDCTRSSASNHDCRSLGGLRGKVFGYAKMRTHSVPSDIPVPVDKSRVSRLGSVAAADKCALVHLQTDM